MSARTGNPVKTAISTIESELGSASRHQSSVGNISGLASCQVWEARSGQQAPEEIQGRNTQCVHAERKSLKHYPAGKWMSAVQETRYRGGNCRTFKGKLYWSRNNKGPAAVGVFVAEEWIDKVFQVQRISDRIILMKLIVGQRVVTFLSVYAPQSGLSGLVQK